MVYEARPVRRRRTKAQIADLDDAIIRAVEADAPVSLRGVFYRVVSAGAVDKSETGYEADRQAVARIAPGRSRVLLGHRGRYPLDIQAEDLR